MLPTGNLSNDSALSARSIHPVSNGALEVSNLPSRSSSFALSTQFDRRILDTLGEHALQTPALAPVLEVIHNTLNAFNSLPPGLQAGADATKLLEGATALFVEARRIDSIRNAYNAALPRAADLRPVLALLQSGEAPSLLSFTSWRERIESIQQRVATLPGFAAEFKVTSRPSSLSAALEASQPGVERYGQQAATAIAFGAIAPMLGATAEGLSYMRRGPSSEGISGLLQRHCSPVKLIALGSGIMIGAMSYWEGGIISTQRAVAAAGLVSFLCAIPYVLSRKSG